MIDLKRVKKWESLLYKLREDIQDYVFELEKLDVNSLENLSGYDVRLHQHIDALDRLVEGTFYLIDQMSWDIRNKKYTGDKY